VPDRWGQGIGRRLVDAVLAEAKERDYIRVRLWTDRANQRAQRLYASCGFYQTGRERDDEVGERIVQYERTV
jgi:RimJ/RimL family protein N-acetyltransferase